MVLPNGSALLLPLWIAFPAGRDEMKIPRRRQVTIGPGSALVTTQTVLTHLSSASHCHTPKAGTIHDCPCFLIVFLWQSTITSAAMGLFSPSFAKLALAAGLFVLYVVGLYIYRAFFDRLSHIPGPKLAAATLWYEFYYDVVLKGRYTWEIARLHEKYGMY